MKLSELKQGESAVIEHIGDESLSAKLFEMGCPPGEPVKLKFIAPFGDPIAIKVAGYTLVMRLSEANIVEIRKL